MDFLYLMIIYLLIFIVGSLALLYRDAAILCTGPIGALRHYVIQAVGSLIPNSVQNVMYSIGNRLLFERTCFFQVIFVILCLLAHAVWLVDMIPILFTHYPNQNHTFWPFVAVFTNYYFFHKAWITDPGEITHSTLNKYKSVYEFDGIIYTGGVTCSTCKITKPARSKHCSVCNRCVHRFDHHCIWTNNCVGAYTHRYFIMFMVSLIAMFLQGIYVGTGCILHYADDVRLFKASFVDTDGSIKPITMSVAFQHLFMALPRLVFLVVAITVLAILVFIFLCQHIYLILSNQTTNETYKVRTIDWQTVTRHNISNHKSKERDSKCQNIHKVRGSHYRPYYRGMLENLIEVFMPDYLIKSKSKVS